MAHETIGHYEVVRMIGEGGMGRVFLARDTMLDRQVALKVLSSASPDGEAVARFEREARALAALDHPNILSIHEFGRVGVMPYVVMELLDGRNLRDVLDEGPMPQATVLAYALEIAHGLVAAHEKGICHRDLKPENIFITTAGRVKIVDFGLATNRMAEQAANAFSSGNLTLTTPGAVIGTVAYMAPEQVRGERTDHRADLFTLGALLFEMFTGKRPFEEPSMVETLHAILKTPLSLAPLEAARVPLQVIEIVNRCLEKSLLHRFQSARDVVFALQNAMARAEWSSTNTATPRSLRVTPSQLSAGRRTSIAVLPFANIGGDAEMEYFSDGVTEDIINALTQVEGLYVAARTSCFAFKGKATSIAEVGAALRVNTVLEGSVRRAGKRLRITAQLIDVADGYHLWSERYDRELDDIFAIQDDIAANIAQKLRAALGEKVADEPLLKPATRNLDAYELYLKARYHVEQRGEGLLRGLEFFQQAVIEDPEYALAFAGMSETLSLLGLYSLVDPREILPRAKAAAERALALDDGLAEAHNAMALVRIHDWDWSGAEEEFDRALQINPSFVPARCWKGLFCKLFVQRDLEGAIRETLRAVELDPMAPIPAYTLGLVLIGTGRFEHAVTCAERALARDPMQAMMYRVLGVARVCLGQYEEAREALSVGATLSMRHPWLVGDLGVVHAANGNRAEAERLQNELLERAGRGFVSHMALAVIPAALGNRDEAVRHIEMAFEQRDPVVITSKTWPHLQELSNDPRVHLLLERMGITWLR